MVPGTRDRLEGPAPAGPPGPPAGSGGRAGARPSRRGRGPSTFMEGPPDGPSSPQEQLPHERDGDPALAHEGVVEVAQRAAAALPVVVAQRLDLELPQS